MLMGLSPGWSSQALSEQIQLLRAAFTRLDEHRVPVGSWLRAAIFRECARVAKSMAADIGSSRQASLQQAAADPGMALITAMQQAMSIPAKDLGDDIGSLTPAGVTQLSLMAGIEASSGAADPDHSEKGGTISKMLQAADQSSQKGLPPQEKPTLGAEGTAGSSSSSAHKPSGSEHADAADAKGDGDDDEDNPMGVDYDGDGEEKEANLPKKRPLPFNSPFTLASEFGIVEKTATFMGFPRLADAELIVPALRLDLEEATADEVESVMADGFLALETKLGGSMEDATVFKLQQAVTLVRMQLLASQKRRKEVCQFIRSTADPKVPQHSCEELDMVLSDQEVRFWMRQHRQAFEAEEKQVARRAHDKYVLKCSARQVEQRQGSRFNGFMKYYFGGSQCIQGYLRNRTFGPRMLPLLGEDWANKPDAEVKRYSNKKSPHQAYAARKRYFEGLLRDLEDPGSEKAQRRKTRRFSGLLRRMEDARQGRAYFHDPAQPSGKDKGESKGKGQGKGKVSTTERCTAALVAAGLDVGPYTDRRRHQQQQQRQQQQQQLWRWSQWHGSGWWY